MHCPVLVREIIGHLSLKPGDVIMDATLGGGGHSQEILKHVLPGGKIIAVDRDPDAIERSKVKFKEVSGSMIFVNEDFRNIGSIIEKSGIKKVNGAVFDLGMSSFQVDEEERGFSFSKDGPLDMRYDRHKGISASDVVNRFSRDEIADIIRSYGEERHARHLANIICSERQKKRIRTTKELSDLVTRAIGRRYTRQMMHPACRTFQALRIFVNDELDSEREALTEIFDHTEKQGRICVISFHSLEDRIAKHLFRDMERTGKVRIVTKRPIVPSEEEKRQNPRSRSAKLRIAERV
ncbi:MAG: 16S rRNA (cytosine(1402)-N(4))-methyltransferase RsmH [Candidatus Omnitrophota bacterium]